MRRRFGLDLACALLLGCANESRPPHAPTSSDEDAGGAGVGVAADGGKPCGEGCPGSTASILPEPTAAELTHAALTDPRCVPLEAVSGFYTPASLFVIDDSVYVFSVDSTEAVPRQLMHVGTLDTLEFEAPSTLLYGARQVDLVQQGGKLRALASRQFYAVELESSDGVSFTQLEQVGPNQPTYDCEGYPPARYFRGRVPVEKLAMGNDYNTGLFGCYERVFVGTRSGDEWSVPDMEIARGDVVFAFQGDERAMIVTTLGVLRSTDGGDTFEAVTGLQASGAAFTGKRLMLVGTTQPSNQGVAFAYSEDDGASWPVHQKLLPDLPYGGLLIAADGPRVAVAVATADAIVLTRSADHGTTWTRPSRIERSVTTRMLALAAGAEGMLWLTADADDAVQVCALR